MKHMEKAKDVRALCREWRAAGLQVGFVPTMGFLHEGHESLIRRSVAENHRTVVSVFVNPLQFGPEEDLERYPRDAKRDAALCAAAGAACLFLPVARELYPEGFRTTVSVAGLADGLCGASRPGHFDGVCTVVCKLLNIVAPDRAYFGEKDAQQLAVVRRMVRDLDLAVDVVGCPIVREPDGLAKSSRNAYLDAAGRRAALALSRALEAGKRAAVAHAGPKDVAAAARAVLEAEPLARIDYVEVVDPATMAPAAGKTGTFLLALAAYVGTTRLIDNMRFEL